MDRDILRRCVLVLVLAGAAPLVHAVDLDPDQVMEDCRSEGEAGGLSGADLKEYVGECVITLLEEIDYSETRKAANSKK